MLISRSRQVLAAHLAVQCRTAARGGGCRSAQFQTSTTAAASGSSAAAATASSFSSAVG